MQQVDTASAVSALPAPTPAGTPGYFQNGVAGVSAATEPGQDWFNSVQGELMTFLNKAGSTDDKRQVGQG